MKWFCYRRLFELLNSLCTVILDLMFQIGLNWFSLENNSLQSIDLNGLNALTFMDIRSNQFKLFENLSGLNRTKIQNE